MKYIVCMILLTSFCSNAFAVKKYVDFSLTGPFIVGGGNPDSRDLEIHSIPQETRVEAGFYFDNKWGGGLGYGSLNTEYTHYTPDLVPRRRDYLSKFKFYYLKGGKTLILSKSLNLELLGRFGRGPFRFQKHGNSKVKSLEANILSLEGRLNYYLFKFLYLSFGTGLRKQLVPDFKYVEGETFSGSDFKLDAYHSLGIGITF